MRKIRGINVALVGGSFSPSKFLDLNSFHRKAGMIDAPPELHTDLTNFSMGRTSNILGNALDLDQMPNWSHLRIHFSTIYDLFTKIVASFYIILQNRNTLVYTLTGLHKAAAFTYMCLDQIVCES